MKSTRWIAPMLGVLALVAVVCFWRLQQESENLQMRFVAIQRGTSQIIKGITQLSEEVQRANEQLHETQTELAAEREAHRQGPAQKTDRETAITPELVQRWLGEASDPTVMRRLNLQARNQVLRRYGDLLEQLELEPAQATQLMTLLADKRQSAVDVAVTAFQRGIDLSQEPERYREIVGGARTGIENQISALLGEARYTQYRDYENSLGQINVLRDVQLSLRDSTEVLTLEQTTRIQGILQESNGTEITAKVISEAKEFLSPLQLQVLQDLRAVQQADERRRLERLQASLTPLPVDPADPKEN
ncbi:MAG: hypothetical protein ABIZ81_11110 [Opitutaceae bacterium]